jgi:hypothetical protein
MLYRVANSLRHIKQTQYLRNLKPVKDIKYLKWYYKLVFVDTMWRNVAQNGIYFRGTKQQPWFLRAAQKGLALYN